MVIVLALILMLAAPALEPPSAPIVWDAMDRNAIPEPKEREISTVYDFVTGSFVMPAAQLLDVPRNVRKLFGKPREAANLNALDEVPNSSWFTNRNFLQPMTVDEIRRGPGDSSPDPHGPWTITQCKTNGISPGMRIQNSKGDTYLMKFDPPDFPELSTAADTIGSKFFYAAGYNVPINSVVIFDPQILKPKDNLQCAGPSGQQITMNAAGIEQFLRVVGRTRDGRIRAIASKFLEGKPKGPFSYSGVREDDPNDTIRHEDRRELRGLRVLAAFLNHSDVKQINTLDTYVGEPGKQFLRHHLIDFGSTLGSATIYAKSGMEGREYIFDTAEVTKAFLSLGLYRRPGDRVMEPLHPSLGYLEGKEFEPSKWKSNYPIAAFENTTDRDGFWGAKIVASFSDEQLAAMVTTGQYSDPIAESVLLEILLQRRDLTADYWFRRVAPLDHFQIKNGALTFEDLAVKARRDQAKNVTYRVLLQSKNLKRAAGTFRYGAQVPLDPGEEPIEVRITRTSPDWPDLTMSVFVGRLEGIPSVLGIQR